MARATGPASGLLLETLERLLQISDVDLASAMRRATDLVASALGADKVDAFLHDPARDTLAAVGSSTQPLCALQKKLGLDVMPVANGGFVVAVFQDGKTQYLARAHEDPTELRGVRDALEIRSEIAARLEIAGEARGVLLVASQTADRWSEEDVRFVETVARWVGMLVHRSDLARDIARSAVEQGRRAAAEELVTVLAHDLRNYIAPIDIRVHLAQTRAERDGRADDVKDLDLARRGLARLGALVTDILDVAKIEQGAVVIAPQPFDLVAVARDLATTLATAQQPVAVIAKERVVVVADRARIRQCLENLVANAIKYSPLNAVVDVQVSRRPTRQGEDVVVEVIDQGPGVAPEVRPHMFERFVTGPAGRVGLGLGLYLAKRIATMHDGDLEVESEPGKGARFCLRIPARLETLE